MAGDLIQSNGNSLPVIGNAGQMAAKTEREVKREVDKAAGRAIVNAANIQAAAFVANVALTQLAMLSAQEANLVAQDPIAAARYAGIVDDFTLVARNTMRRMAQ